MMSGTRKIMDTTVPRPAPRFPLLPAPFNFEKPVAQVPDISLIYDSAASSPQQRQHSSSTNFLDITPSTPTSVVNNTSVNASVKQPSSFEVQVLYDMMKKQEETISKMSEQIKSVIEYQSTHFSNVETMLTKLTTTENLPVKTSEQSVQTDKVEDNNHVVVHAIKSLQSPEERVIVAPPPSSTAKVQMDDSSTDNNKPANIERSRNSSGSSSSSSPSTNNNTNNNRRKDTVADPNQSVNPCSVTSSESKGSNRMENLSTILKDLQLPTIQETSLFSEASVQPIDLQDYNDSMDESDLENQLVGPKSASAYGSSSDEEVVQPTATFYRNVIGNVNRMLENNQETTFYGSSDMTVYGMSSNNLSFATKQYLQKYGLVKPKSKVKSKEKQRVNTPPEANRKFSNEELPQDNNRVLDLTALKNQPKLL